MADEPLIVRRNIDITAEPSASIATTASVSVFVAAQREPQPTPGRAGIAAHGGRREPSHRLQPATADCMISRRTWKENYDRLAPDYDEFADSH